MKKFLIILFPLIFCLNSCEEIVEGETLPYEEKLVVRAEWQPKYNNNLSTAIKVTRTLPVLEEYSAEKAEVKDADVSVEIDGVQHKLTYISMSLIENSCYILEEFSLVQPGKEYKLTVNWHGKTAYSTMRIPLEPEVLNVRVDTTSIQYSDGTSTPFYNFRASVKPRPNECYVMTYELTDKNSGGYHSSTSFNNIHRSEEIEPDGFVHLINGTGVNDFNDYNVTLYIHAFDSQYYEYFATRYNNNTDSPLSEPSKVQWNVKGDGIGMFTGYSTTAVEIK